MGWVSTVGATVTSRIIDKATGHFTGTKEMISNPYLPPNCLSPSHDKMSQSQLHRVVKIPFRKVGQLYYVAIALHA